MHATPRDTEVPVRGAEHDVVVVGGRCAGAATAYLLASLGHDVAVVERASMPSDTLSTHGIARGGVVQLARWGLLDGVLATGAPAIRSVTFGSPAGTTRVAVKERAGVDHLLAPRRVVLDALLLDAARGAGATVYAQTVATGLLRAPDGRVTGVAAVGRRRGGSSPAAADLRARHVVGADGIRSTVAREAGAPILQAWEPGVALFYAYVDQVRWDGFELYAGERSYAGVFPTHDDAACVWVIRPTALLENVRRAGARRAAELVASLATASPDLARRVRQGRFASSVHGWVGPPCFQRRPHGPGWSLVGDAGYYRDPITGHGITDAFRDAELLASALDRVLTGEEPEHAALSAFELERDLASAPVFDITERMTRFPSPRDFTELQVELSKALDHEASALASRPAPAGLGAATAA